MNKDQQHKLMTEIDNIASAHQDMSEALKRVEQILDTEEITDEDYRDEPVAAVNLSDHDSDFTLGRVYKITNTDHRGYNLRDDGDDPRWRGWSDSEWQLLYPGKVYAQAPLEGCPGYATPGKCYEVRKEHGRYFRILDDEDDHCLFTWNDSYQINGKNWTRIIPENL